MEIPQNVAVVLGLFARAGSPGRATSPLPECLPGCFNFGSRECGTIGEDEDDHTLRGEVVGRHVALLAKDADVAEFRLETQVGNGFLGSPVGLCHSVCRGS